MSESENVFTYLELRDQVEKALQAAIDEGKSKEDCIQVALNKITEADEGMVRKAFAELNITKNCCI